MVAVHLRSGHGEQHNGRIDKRRAGAHRDQGVHVGSPVEQTLKAADEKLLVDHHDNAREQHLDDPHGHMISVKKGGQRPSKHHMPHGKVHEYQQKAQGRDQPLFQDRRLVVLQRLFFRRDLGRKAPGRPCALCSLGRRAVSGVLHCLHNIRCRRSSLNAERIGQKTHVARRDARHLGYRFLHARLAGRAAHSCYCILLHN